MGGERVEGEISLLCPQSLQMTQFSYFSWSALSYVYNFAAQKAHLIMPNMIMKTLNNSLMIRHLDETSELSSWIRHYFNQQEIGQIFQKSDIFRQINAKREINSWVVNKEEHWYLTRLFSNSNVLVSDGQEKLENDIIQETQVHYYCQSHFWISL